MKHLHLNPVRRLAATLLVALLVPLGAWAQQYDFTAEVDGNTLYFKITDATNHYVSVVSPSSNSWYGFTKPTGAISLPASVTNEATTYTLTAVGNFAFYDCTDVTAVTIPSAVKSIGNYAFQNTSISALEVDIETIGTRAFSGNKSLASLTIGPNVKSIDGYAFENCTALESVTYNATACEPTSGAQYSYIFYGCNHAATLTIGAGVTSLPNYLFRGFTGLKEVTIPATVTALGRYVFADCNLDRLVIEDSTTPLSYNGQYAPFYGDAAWSGDHYNYTGCKITSAYIGRQLNNTYDTTNPTYMRFANYIENLELGANVTDISRQFYTTGGLQNITVNHTTPIAIADDAFCNTEGMSYTGGNQYGTATLWVPAGKRSAYAAADGWKNFSEIRPTHFIVNLTATKGGTLA